VTWRAILAGCLGRLRVDHIALTSTAVDVSSISARIASRAATASR